MKTPHPHAAFIAEAAQDVNRKILGKHIRGDYWEEVTLTVVVQSGMLWEFCFADTLKPKVVSSLTDEELFAIARKRSAYHEDINLLIIRDVADAAAAKHDAEVSTNGITL